MTKAGRCHVRLAVTALALLGVVSSSTVIAQTLLVGNKGEDSVSFIDLTNGREIARTQFGPAPHEIALSPDGREAAVVAYGGAAIAILDVASRDIVETIDLGRATQPHGIIWHANGRIYATAEGADAIVEVTRRSADNPAQVRTISTRPSGAAANAGSHMLAVNHAATRAWTANLRSGTVTLIDLVRGQALREAVTGGGTEGIALSPDEATLWVTARDSGVLLALDPDRLTIQRRLAVGAVPLRVILSPDGAYAVTANFGDGTIAVVDTARGTVVDRLTVPGGGEAQLVTLLFSADGSRLYAALTRINRIAEYSFPDGRLLGLLAAGGQGDGLAMSPVTTAPRQPRLPAP